MTNVPVQPLQNDVAYSDTALTKGKLRAIAPAIFATEPHEDRGENYSFVPTIEVVDDMRKAGFLPFFATQMRSKIRPEQTKHMIKFRHESSLGPKASKREGVIPEIILINAHDGTSNYVLYTGVYRIVSELGLIAGSSFDPVKLRHNKNPIAGIVEESETMINDSGLIVDRVREMKEITLGVARCKDFALQAAAIKSGDENDIRFDVVQLLEVNRKEDAGKDLWTIFNVVQENLMKGGIPGKAPDSDRNTKTRSIRNINEIVRLSRGLWDLAESYVPALQKAALKAVAETERELTAEEELEALRRENRSLKRKLGKFEKESGA